MQRRTVVPGMMVVVAVLTLAAVAAAGSAVTDVTVDQARALLDRPPAGLVVLDVRTPEEFTQGHLGGAQNLNVLAADFEQRLGKLDRGKPYLVYCRTGNRSVRAVQTMTRLGFTNLSHMAQGIVAWQAKQLPLVR